MSVDDKNIRKDETLLKEEIHHAHPHECRYCGLQFISANASCQRTSNYEIQHLWDRDKQEEDDAVGSSEYIGESNDNDILKEEAYKDIDMEDVSSVRCSRNTPGRKPTWLPSWEDDLVDVIVKNEKFLRLIRSSNAKNGHCYAIIVEELQTRCAERNEAFPMSVKQTRNKFKRMTSICRYAASNLKTRSILKQFQDNRGYGKWFNALLPIVSKKDRGDHTRITQLAPSPTTDVPQGTMYKVVPPPTQPPASNASFSSIKKIPEFVSIPPNAKKSKYQSAFVSTVQKEESPRRDKTDELIQFLKEDAERQRKRDEQFQNLMKLMISSQSTPPVYCIPPQSVENSIQLSTQQPYRFPPVVFQQESNTTSHSPYTHSIIPPSSSKK